MRAANSPVSITLKYFTREAASGPRDGGRTSRGQVAPERAAPAEKLTAAGVNLTSPKSLFFFSSLRAKKGKFRVFILQLCHHPEVEGCKTGALLSAHAHGTLVKAANAKHSPGMCCGSAVAARWIRRGNRPSSGGAAHALAGR